MSDGTPAGAGPAPGWSHGAVAWWRGRPPATRAVLGLLALIVLVNAALSLLDRLTAGSQPSGPPSSSLATAAAGYEAWADLLAQQGHPVARLLQPLDHGLPRPQAATVVVADPASLSTGEIAALGTFLRAGGRVVALGVATLPLLDGILGPAAPRWGPAGVSGAAPLAPAPETAGVSAVQASGTGGSFSSAGGTTPILGDGGHLLLATVAGVGRGRLVMFSDSSVFSNAELGYADDALLSLDVVGAAGRSVAFDENAHGYGAGVGISGLPVRWQWTLLYSVLGAGLWLWSRARRLGPPEDPARRLPPARRRYVEALATVLAGTRRPDAAARPVRDAARERLAARAGCPSDAADELLARAAAEAGVPADVTGAVLSGGAGDPELLALGRALTWLEGGGR